MENILSQQFEPVVREIEQELIGKRDVIIKTMTAFFAKGHLLLEDIPGVGKTTLAKSFAIVMGLDFGRIQFTSDLLPSDILGVSYFDAKSGQFRLKKGPIFTQFLLADEINRSMPKTQSALLEAMEEGFVTIDGVSYELPKPFFVMATQNPLEEYGTFPLPHSQLDRFICSFGIGYPDPKAEREALIGKSQKISLKPIMNPEIIMKIQSDVQSVSLSSAMLDYIQKVVSFTRESGIFVYGLSTRGALALVSMIRSWAYLHGRDYAVPDDLLAVVGEVCVHRLKFKEGKSSISRIVDEISKNISPES